MTRTHVFAPGTVDRMITNTVTSAREEEIPVMPARRFSEGMERSPLEPSTLRVGRFSDGTAPSPVLSADMVGSFADGLVDRSDPSKPRRVGSFGDGYDAVADRRRAGPRRPAVAAPAQA
jgi:hypothetical protein